MDSADAARMESILKEGPDWPAVMASAHRLGVEPLLYKHLSQEKYACYAPDEVIHFLKRRYRQQAMSNLRIYAQISRILDSMNQADVPIILLKGAFLAKWVYGDIALRPMNDIDILCREEHAETVKKRLHVLGYYQEAPPIYKSPLHEKIWGKKSSHMSPFLKNGATRIEIHINIFGKTSDVPEEMTRLWETAIPSDLNGLRAYSLSPEYEALYLSVHLSKHLMSGGIVLYWLCDIHEVLRKYSDRIHWKDFWDRAASLGLGPQICLVLGLLRSHWNGSFPEMDAYCPGAEIDGPGLETIVRAQFKAKRAKNLLPSYMANLKMVRDIEGWRYCLYYLWKTIFPARANLISRYRPSSRSVLPLYYIIHPCTLCKRTLVSLYYNRECIGRILHTALSSQR